MFPLRNVVNGPIPYTTTRHSHANWALVMFSITHLLSSKPSPESSTALDKMILLSWVVSKLPPSDNERFVISHWDMRPSNILIDKQHNLVG